jgi:hypothetical protein
MTKNVIPLDPKKRPEAAVRLADLSEAQEAVAILVKALPIMPSIQDPPAFKAIMAERLAPYPTDVLVAAVRKAIDDFKAMPSIHEMLELCEGLIEPRRAELRALEAAQRREQQAAEVERKAQREQEREAYRQADLDRLRKLEARARERLGDDGPLPGDVELADSLSGRNVYRAGTPVSWQAALAAGERWAVQYCRQIALAARVIRAHEHGKISWANALPAVKLIVADEAGARRWIEEKEGRQAGHPDQKLPEAFWRALWKIRGKCGLDVPLQYRREERAATALENLKHLEGLAHLGDTRAMIDAQTQKEWEARRSARRAKASGT